MNERKITLIKAGMKLFAEKGYHKTSVQDIATKAGISKGAFYLSFASKEKFIGTAIQYFYNELITKVNAVEDSHTNKKRLFIKQIDVITTYVYNSREFIMMLFREDVSFGHQAEQLFQQMKVDNFYWLKKNIEAIYEDQVDHYMIDAVIQVEGLLTSYFQWIVIDDIRIDRKRLGAFIIERLDDLIYGMRKKEEIPLVKNDQDSITLDLFGKNYPNDELLLEIITKLKKLINELSVSDDKKSELMEVTDILQKEQESIVIQGLLAHLQQYKSLQPYCERLAKLFQVELLNK